MTVRVVMTSGGLASWWCGRLAAAACEPGDHLVLLFADVGGDPATRGPHDGEDEDTYRFIEETTAATLDSLPEGVTGEFVHLIEGRTIWQVFHDKRYLGNSRLANCSDLLKQKPCREWMLEHVPAEDGEVWVGIDGFEAHRLPAIERGWAPWSVVAPLMTPPFPTRDVLLERCRELGHEPPRAYALGYAHNNCGGFCVRSGMAAFELLLKTNPERYAYHAQKEEELRAHLDKPVSIMRGRGLVDRLRSIGLSRADVEEVDGRFVLKATGEEVEVPNVAPITMLEFGQKVAVDDPTIDHLDFGGCGCFFDESSTTEEVSAVADTVSIPLPRQGTHDMTVEQLNAPAALAGDDGPIYDRNGVRRSKDGRPYVMVRCPKRCDGGRIEGKRKGTTKKCPACDGLTGWKETLYTRCTSFVGALEDRQNLEAWQKRVVLLGIAASHKGKATDPTFLGVDLLSRLAETDPDDREALNRLADEAYELGDGYRKAQKGTDLHELTERVDRGEPLPDDVTLEDRRDMAGWYRLREEYALTMLDVERFVVQDELRVAGTYDRRAYSPDPRLACEVCDTGRAMNRPKILDLKTGRVDYGGGKMRQQLALYANSVCYDPETGQRSEHDVCPHVGFIIHLPAGTGSARVYRADLVAGWADVKLSAAVRQHRRESATALVPLALDASELLEAAGA